MTLFRVRQHLHLHKSHPYITYLDNYTLFLLWRTHSFVSTSTSSDPFHPPRRLFFPNIPTFKGIQPDLNGPVIRRHRSDSGFHPYLPKAAFPLLGLMYQEDWEDYALMEVPFVFKRLVVADFGAAARSTNDMPPFALKQRFSPKKNDNRKLLAKWTLKDMPDPQGHRRSTIELYGIEAVPVVVPNIHDAAGLVEFLSEFLCGH
ncbi:hypothetical protein EDB19DRAFT_1943709 [Suillus lakei]|nr:hypothetical protein EDB19DRAFT_1943709 [Suillus lakei]